ncbi:hypothetical protein J41TS12_06250 [Paenibacillus antibioticophila]|uniref:Uncharacterized protein n=1 Tax=Paenibacillus antibioticophila TaxID=1274374 RepID=A0A919XN07_9BACL|nr:hypothetical protein J41TS12_06250 [Paenibacillus antibioticophila]
MNFKKHQIQQLMFEYEHLSCEYDEMVMEALDFLDAKNNGVYFYPETWDFYIDVKGHCWAVNNNN